MKRIDTTWTEAIICGEQLWLHPDKALFWEREKTLFVADLHFGKIAHFRKAGIAIPKEAAEPNWTRLRQVIVDFLPEKVCFLGDLFHSSYNREWEKMGDLTRAFASIEFELISGNHDLLHGTDYERVGITVLEDAVVRAPFLLTHEPAETIEAGLYNLAGHIHPGVRMCGLGRQTLRVPCFYFAENQGILPAFGQFTGKFTMRPKKADRVFIVVNEEVLPA